MAHVGKRYPLHFRRDLSLQSLVNVRGWAEQYAYQPRRLDGSIGRFLHDGQFVLDTNFNAAGDHLDIVTAYQVINGHQIRIELHSVIVGDPQHWQGVLTINDQTRGNLYQEQWTQGITGDYIGLGRSPSDATIMETPIVCFRDVSIGFFDSGAQAVPWPP